MTGTERNSTAKTFEPIDPSIVGEQYLDGVQTIIDNLDELKNAEDARQASMKSPYTIRQIFSEHPEYWEKDSGVVLTPEQREAAWCIANCKTRNMGGFTASYCPKCGYSSLHYKSCGNRNCPSCQYPLQQQWIEDRRKEVVPGQPYYHVILTCDHRLNPLFACNQKLLVGLYFSCASAAVIDLCRDTHYLGGTPGIIAVLHSWRQDLLPHWHLHCIISGCGLTSDKRFVSILDKKKSRSNQPLEDTSDADTSDCIDDEDDESENKDADHADFFLPLAALMNLFRNKFMDGLRDLWKTHQLVIPDSHMEWNDFSTWASFCREVSKTKWIGKIVKAFHPHGTTDAIDYLARYVFRTAISNNRIVRYDGEHVTFTVRDNHNPGQKKECTLHVKEFIHRFLFHVLDKYVTRVRYSGYLCNNQRKKNLQLIAKLTGITSMLKNWPSDDDSSTNENEQTTPVLQRKSAPTAPIQEEETDTHKDIENMMHKFFSTDICHCPKCNSQLIVWPPRPKCTYGTNMPLNEFPERTPEMERRFKAAAARADKANQATLELMKKVAARAKANQ